MDKMKKRLEKCIFGKAKIAFTPFSPYRGRQGTSVQNAHTLPPSTYAAGVIFVNILNGIIFFKY
jgi:hypothetical protein